MVEKMLVDVNGDFYDPAARLQGSKIKHEAIHRLVDERPWLSIDNLTRRFNEGLGRTSPARIR